jgi:c(7)-type cytochrome triheme protein
VDEIVRIGAQAKRVVSMGVISLFLAGGSALADVLGDIKLDRRSTANGVNAVIFPHWRHRVHFKCYACHPEPFEMRAGSNDISMDAVRTGSFCGRCHDGRTAFPVSFDTCRTCHSGPAG